MRIETSQRIAGLPALQVRRLLRRGRQRTWDADFVRDVLGIEPPAARTLIAELERLGLVQPEEDAFCNTVAGNALASATAARPVRRATAERALAQFMQRVEQVNTDAYYLYRVRCVVLFGSYLSGDATLNDVDLAVSLAPKESDPEKRWAAERPRRDAACDAGRSFSSYLALLAWPLQEVLLALRARSRVISLHDLDDDAELIRAGPFEVLYATPGSDRCPKRCGRAPEQRLGRAPRRCCAVPLLLRPTPLLTRSHRAASTASAIRSAHSAMDGFRRAQRAGSGTARRNAR